MLADGYSELTLQPPAVGGSLYDFENSVNSKKIYFKKKAKNTDINLLLVILEEPEPPVGYRQNFHREIP